MSDHIDTSSRLTSLPSSPPLQSVDDFPTEFNNSTYSSTPTVQVPDSTPIKHSLQTSEQFSASPPPPADSLHPKLDAEMRQAFVGPMSAENFLNDFLPVKDVPTPSTSPGLTELAQATSETQMYGLFVNTVNSLFKNFKAFDTSKNPSIEVEAQYKPDVTIYEDDSQDPPRALTSFQKMEMFVEFKYGNTSDPFDTENEPFAKLLKNTCSTRGQITLYSARQQAYQFRTSVLTVGIFGKIARLFRWDRTGSKVTEPIDYSTTQGNRYLTEFFARFDQMSPEARGWDPTVKNATDKEINDFSEAVMKACERRSKRGKKAEDEDEDPLFSKLVESVGHRNQYPRKRVSVIDGDKIRHYIVGRPTSVVKSPTGRATRGFVAMSVETKRLVFLKDSWRPDVEGVKAEDYWYGVLRQKRAKHIGAFSHGSDVYGAKKLIRCHDKKQRTLTQLYAKEHGGLDTMMGYIHYRVVQPELYLPLEMFRSSKHLTSVMLDIALAIKHVHEAGIFHRDLSPGNIMIDVHGRGRLIDFDLARYRNETGARQALRTGTWQFMSTEQLANPGKIYEVSDELESFFFVIFYEGVHWVAHNKPVRLNAKHIFDHVETVVEGNHVGGAGKRDLYSEHEALICQQLKFTKSKPFTDLIRQLYRLFQSLRVVNMVTKLKLKPPEEHSPNVEKLRNCKEVVRLMKEAVARKDWLKEFDKVPEGNYPRKEKMDENDLIGLSYLNKVNGTKRGLEEAVGGDGYKTPTKRSRVN
ncbi:hypothetical protein BDM02DRAFT_3271085 [Thelephora ganbajun]|uniref:Uncharacterized protein n=1 Tax=Thelephora ganbajun TaxID=370292 RepID=A0ACB6Z9N3_THEGA|nr:hypothetical protein BDM02DRAFT_3271085 [Thelephora ganbajun]